MALPRIKAVRKKRKKRGYIMPPENSDNLLGLDQVAVCLGVSKVTVRRYARQGDLACVRIGPRGDRRFRPEDVRNFIILRTQRALR